jgi:hypothetical protein
MAEIVPFPLSWKNTEEHFRDQVNLFGLTAEAADWIHKDCWPRLNALWQDWKIAPFEGDDEFSRLNNQAAFTNLASAFAQLLAIEVQLYEARTGKSAR